MIMCKLITLPCRLLLLSLVVLSLCMTSFHFTTRAQNPPKQSGPRRPLPKPPTGSRGFEQTGRDASSRFIAAGATRGPLKPIAPVEGLAYNAGPFFAWTPAPGASSYHFVLRDGPDSAASIVYETDAKVAQLSYSAEAPALSPGKLYSWRVSTAGVMERKFGAAASFFVLAGEDAAQVRTALEKAKLLAPKSAAEHLAQARIFEQYGVWYDALRIATELLDENPNNADAKAFYDSLIKRLKDDAAKAASQSSALGLRLWREVEPLVAGGNERAALAAINGNINGASALYRELLFDAVDSRLYNNPPISPNAERVRALLAQSNAENAALEAKLAVWSKERKLGEGFQNSGEGMEQLLYLYIAAEPSNIKNQKVSDGGKPATSRELTEAALQTAEEIGSELPIAACAGNLAYYAIQERRVADTHALLERAGEIWKNWRHPVGLAVAAYLNAESYALVENWQEASTSYKQAAQLAAALTALRPLRVAALAGLAWSLRNQGDKDGVLAALTEEVAEQERIVYATTDLERHTKQAKRLSDLQIELGAALAALNRYAEAGERYARADRMRDEIYGVERARFEKTITEWEAKLKAAKFDKTFDESKRKTEIMRAGMILDSNLSFLSNQAAERNDWGTLAAIAERRVAAARESGDQEKLADALDAGAKSYLAAKDLAKARVFAEDALHVRSADTRRRYLYSSVEILADIAYDADQTREAETRYREVLEVTKPEVLPPPYDLNAEPDETIRNIRAQMNAGERTSRQMSAIDARLRIATLLQHKGNFSQAEQEYEAAAGAILRLYAAGAPDETELVLWLSELEKSNNPLTKRIKTTDIIAHRSQTGFKNNKDEMDRLQQVDVIAAGLRATLALSRASLLDDQGDLNAAAKAYEDAIRQTTNVLGGAFSMTASYLVLARIERERGNYTAAEAPLATALAEYQRKHDAWGITGVLSQQSELRRQQGRLDEAQRLANDALRICNSLGSRTATAGILRTLGRVESDLGGDSLKASERHLRDSLAIWREFGLRGQTAYTLSFLGLTEERLNHDDDALASYEEAVKLVETLTASLSKNVSADTFNSTRANRELYDRLIKLLIKRGRLSDALEYLERAKSKSLVDALAGANINAKDPALKALIDRVRSLGDSVRVAETTLVAEMQKSAEQRSTALVAAARTRVESAQKQYHDAVAQIQQANPSYANLVAVNPTDLGEVRKRLPAKTLLLEYFPTDNELYIFVVTRDNGPTIRTVAIGRADLAKLVKQYREALNSAEEQSVRERSLRGALWRDDGKEDFKRDILPIKDATSRLYQALIAPAQTEVDQADTLVIVPAAELYYLPIHALGHPNQDGSFSFLVEQKGFAYLASADLLNAVSSATVANHSPRVGTARTLLALGNPDGSLPGANMEVSALGRIFAGASIFTGKEATVARIAQSTAHSSYIHFATHGFINSLEPKETYLLLAGQPDRLSVKDIVEDNYKLSLEGTRLVTLSACETNIGGYDPSAVYSSLSRAFSKAGAPTVVASLWSVNDVSTRDTMTNFYKEMAAGQSKAEALRRAQVATMHDPRFAHPYYWAPFIILGDWR
jgi:CHAT domain-containing protein